MKRSVGATISIFVVMAATAVNAQETPWRFIGVTPASNPDSAWFIGGEPSTSDGTVSTMLARVQASGFAQVNGQSVGYELWFPDIDCAGNRYGLRGQHFFGDQGRVFFMADPDRFEEEEVVPAGSAIALAMEIKCRGRSPADPAVYSRSDLIASGRAKLSPTRPR